MSHRNEVFCDGSMVRKIYGVAVVNVMSGMRALVLQALQPVALTGLLKDTDILRNPHVRFARTMLAMETIYWGTWEEAREITARIAAMHRGVRGKVGANAGALPEKTAYSARDPRLQQWVLGSIMDSAIACYEQFVAPLTLSEKDRFVREYRVVADLFELPESFQFADYQQLASYMEGMYATFGNEDLDPHQRLSITPAHRQVAMQTNANLMSGPLTPFRSLWLTAVKGVLPENVREYVALSWALADAQIFQSMLGMNAGSLLLVRLVETMLNAAQAGASSTILTRWLVPFPSLAKKVVARPTNGPLLYQRNDVSRALQGKFVRLVS